MKSKKTIVGYTSKKGITANYKLISEFTKQDGLVTIERVKLEGFGVNPFSFWVDKSCLVPLVPVKAKEGAERRKCWECGCEFTWADAANAGGEWAESYCGC